jgi:hypothetical protein
LEAGSGKHMGRAEIESIRNRTKAGHVTKLIKQIKGYLGQAKEKYFLIS